MVWMSIHHNHRLVPGKTLLQDHRSTKAHSTTFLRVIRIPKVTALSPQDFISKAMAITTEAKQSNWLNGI